MIKSAIVINQKGIHARTAAMIASYVYDLKRTKAFDMWVLSQAGNKIPIGHAVQIASLAIKRGDIIHIEATGKDGQSALELVCHYIEKEIDNKIITLDEIDRVLDDNIIRIHSEMNSLKTIKNQLSTILDNLNDGVCMMDRNGIIVYLNSAYERIFNVDKTAVLNKNARELFPTLPSVKALGKIEVGHKEVFEVNGIKIISNATPIINKGQFEGFITSYSLVDGFTEVMKQLKIAEEQANYYKKQLEQKDNIHEAFKIIIGESDQLKDVLATCSKAARTSATVVIRGESGTGKELVAKSIHMASKRSKKPMIKINCAAFPENLIESELFGFEKGAFTGANNRKLGKFELADGGTLFLDEIGELSQNVQVKLLRFLQEREFMRIGGNELVKVDVRIIAATNRHLEEMLEHGTFREDLYYRLSVIQLFVPPLRDRMTDIPLLADYFINKMAQKEEMDSKILTGKVLDIFYAYQWPGNIRELENVIMRGMTMSEDDRIDVDMLPKHMKGIETPKSKSLINVYDGEFETMESYDKEIISRALKKYGSYNKTAKALGLTHRTISLKAKKYGVDS